MSINDNKAVTESADSAEEPSALSLEPSASSLETSASLSKVTQAQFYQQLAESISDLIVTTDLELNLTYVSPSVEPLIGYGASALLRAHAQPEIKKARETKQTELAKEVVKARASVQASSFTLQLTLFLHQELKRLQRHIDSAELNDLAVRELQVTHRNGEALCLEVKTSPLFNERGELAGMFCIGRDITARKETEDNLALAAKVFENSLTGIYITDVEGKIIQVNSAFTRITGFRPGEAIGYSPSLMDVDRYAKSFFKSIDENLVRKDYWEGEIQHRHKDGRVFPAWVAITVLRDSDNKVINTISTFTDITEKKSSEVKIQRLAYFDALTGLPNRSLFNDRLGQSLNRAKRSSEQVGLLFLDLDRFKSINDSLGHALGDALLQQVAHRLSECVRKEDTVARMGGDEFTIILGDLADRQHAISAAAHVAEKIRHSLSEPFTVNDREVFSGCSMGIAFYPSDGDGPKALLQNADTAMYHAKAVGKNNYQFFTSAMNQRALDRLEIESALHQAIHKSQFELHFQPILDAGDGCTVAVEALIRWNHPKLGLVMPGKFIAIAEESGLIKPIGAWVLRQACEQLAQWQSEGKQIKRMAVNVSAKQFVEGYILQTLREVIAATKIDPHCLELELTESALMQDHNYSMEVLQAMKRMGIRISVDDFGTGYSSLNYLKKFPIDNLKVDRSFVEGLPGKEDQQIVQAIVALARSLNLKVIAEGVETPIQLEYLQGLGCEEVQGFMLSKPLPPNEIPFLH